ncbi:MAG: ABC transporter ATP-binding protein [Angelakisella sp.]|jgi:ATP-binding cassette subfamily B protein|nr:ABC transporter ATP-binding protein [Angelakisella sp.]
MLFRLFRYFRPYKKLLALDLFCAFFLSAFDLFYPTITSKIIDTYIPGRMLRELVFWLSFLLVCYLLKAACKNVVIYYGHAMGVRIQTDMRRQVFQKLQELPFSYFDRNKTGVIMSRIVGDLQDISEFTHHGPEEVFITAVTLIGSFAILSRSSLPLTLIIFAIFPLIVLAAVWKKRKMNRAFAQMRRTVGEMNAELESSIAGIRVSRAFTGEAHESHRFERANQTFRQSREYGYRAMGEYYTLLYFLTDILYWATLTGAAFFTYSGAITAGMLVQYILYVTLFMNSTRRLVDFAEMYEMGMTGFARFLEIMDCDSEREVPGAPALPPVKGDIRFRDVSFAYAGDEEERKAVLRHLDLTVEAGQKVAIVGPSGSGKTTLCHLIPRFYDTTAGQILVDGADITQVDLSSLRRQVGIVQQDVFLFPGSFRENIAYGDFDATPEQIEEAAKRANIHDFILAQPQGYDTLVGERGVRLSGGQKQRIAIARVFLKNPAILILDEATSALDNATELMIQQALDELCRGRTTLIVAHRLSTIQGADKIVVLTEEGIQEEGSHRELLERDGLYARLYRSQFAHQPAVM